MSEVREGQKVKLFAKAENGSDKEIECCVKEIYNDRLTLSFADELLDYSDYSECLEEGNDVSVRIFTPYGIRVFDSLVLDSPIDDYFVIEYAEENTVDIQRREYFRTKFQTKICIEKQNKKNVIAYTLEISGSGIMFYSEENFVGFEQVALTLYMPEDRAITALGQVLEKPYLSKNQHVICFTRIDEKDRDRIIKKRFELQLKEHEY